MDEPILGDHLALMTSPDSKAGSGDTHTSCSHEKLTVSQRGEHLVVDIHAHMNIVAADELVRAAMPELPRGLPFSCPASDEVNARMFKKIGPKLNGITERLADMDRLGVDVQALSPNPGQYYYFTTPDLGLEAARLINDAIAEAVASEPQRLVGIGTVPLQDEELAIREMTRCVRECGMRGIEIGTYVDGRELSDKSLESFFRAAMDLDILIFIHPLGFSDARRMTEHYLNNIIGNPLESTLALSHLIFGGVLDKFPGLKICVAHGGGYLPAYWGRMDHAFRAREDCRQHISREPSSYLRQVWLDTLVFDQQELDSLIRMHGADRLCLGTDYPFDMGEPDPIGFLAKVEPEARRKLLGLNAAALLGLEITAFSTPE